MPTEAIQPPKPPRAVAVSGMIFSVLFVIGLALIRLAVPADPADTGEWLAGDRRDSVRAALNLIPFTGIAFLWFMAVLRNRIGMLEDRFFATVFLGSGLLFVGLLFIAAAISAAILETLLFDGRVPAQSETYIFCRRASYLLINTYAIKMAAVFIFVTSSIGLRTDFLPRWLAYIGFASGLVMLLVIADFAWIALLLPLWVLLVSVYILIADLRQQPEAKSASITERISKHESGQK
jgi:hypothetical protein